ncbi:hypothetical protein [Deinococcus ruber]|uniref:hypothetical protein n=1 Tax=Deinococcus ruber TaxID=1848197 RepID=UPI0016692013|nr:hypothetical protein [Deinococcus ruber]
MRQDLLGRHDVEFHRLSHSQRGDGAVEGEGALLVLAGCQQVGEVLPLVGREMPHAHVPLCDLQDLGIAVRGALHLKPLTQALEQTNWQAECSNHP